ncbi:YraN family protein [Roseovarius sp. MBR-6]|uniref:YraN family protein n=1 Tax=Roseovarius sp. MBR-6 TaxID=3156459 RepID=UPI00339165BE
MMRQLAFDFDAAPTVGMHQGVPQWRQERGRRAFLSGQAAEDMVARLYEGRGVQVLARRWRGISGEIDLVLRAPDTYVFCEVKRAATHDLALQRLHQGQLQRIYHAASEYIGLTPEGQLAPVLFDVATVDGIGSVNILEAAFGLF